MEVKVNNYLNEGYNAPCTIFVTGTAKTRFKHPELLNGFDDSSWDYTSNIFNKWPELEEVLQPKSYMTLLWNKADKKLYSVNKFTVKKPLSEEWLEKIAKKVQGQWSDGAGEGFEQSPVMEYEGEEVYVSPWHKDQELNVAIMPVQLPEGYYFLGTLFDSPERQMMYEEFLECPIMYARLRKMCELAKMDIPEEAETSAALPIHGKDTNTGELLVSEKVLKVFDQYQYAQNYIRGFEPGTAEHGLGKRMMLSPKFCEFMMDTARMQNEGKEIHDLEGNYTKAINEADKYILKHPEKKKLFDTYWND